MHTIVIKNLQKFYGRTRAVDDVSLTVDRGEIFGFLGPNGAGKTTTIRCMMNFIRPNAGSISILGKDAQKDSIELKKQIGYLPSESQLYEGWNGWDHIRFSEGLNGASEIVNDLIGKLAYNPKLKVKTLSSGNKKKLGLILALMHRPALLILDEPTSGLDPILQNTFYKTLIELQGRGTTVFMSSHNLPEVEQVCSRVGVIKNGKMAASESIASLRSKRIYKVTILFNEKVNQQSFKTKNILIDNSFDNSLVLQVKGDINPLLAQISKHKVKDIQIEPASLENIFLEFYR